MALGGFMPHSLLSISLPVPCWETRVCVCVCVCVRERERERERRSTNHWWFHYFHSSLLSSWDLDHCCRLLQSCGITPWLTVSIKARWSLRRVVEHLNDSPDLCWRLLWCHFTLFRMLSDPCCALSFVLVAYVFNSFVLSCVEVYFHFSVPKDSTASQDKY